MSVIPRVTKGAASAYSHTFVFSGWPQLQPDSQGDYSDTLATATASVSPTGLTLGTPTVDAAAITVSVPLSGGTLGTTYRVTVLATTALGDVLDGYLDVKIGTGADGAVIYPSQLLPYIDNARLMELLYDQGELVNNDTDPPQDTPLPDADTIDGNQRAFALSQQAWRTVLAACRRGNIYLERELIDLAGDDVRGQDLISLVADIFWCRLIKRRRYTAEEPQGKDPACKESEERLQLLRQGERIFDLEGVASSNSDGSLTGDVYTNIIGEYTALTVGQLGTKCRSGRDNRFWGCTDDDTCHPRGGSVGGGCGGGC